MNRPRLAGLLILAASAAVFLCGGLWIQRSTPLALLDFKALYYGTHCYLSGCDPYNTAELDRFFLASGGAQPGDPPAVRAVVTHFVNFPTVFLFATPFALLPWTPAHLLWTTLTCACYFLACFLIWSVCAARAPVASALLIGVLLASSQTLFAGGNTVGFVVSLTVIAAWCFIRRRFGWAGALCLAVALLLKPHDAGLVWLFFLLAGGAWRKRALRSFGIAAVLALIAAAWAFHSAPRWLAEQHANLALLSGPGGMNSPAPGSGVDRSAGMVVDLQSALAIFHNNAAFYNSVTYAFCGMLLLLCARKVVRAASTESAAWFALAAIVPLTMLVAYHKPYDMKLLLLAVPACILLWAHNDLRGQTAFLLTFGAIFFCADLPLAIYEALTDNVRPDLHTFTGKLLALLVLRPATLFLLALVAFYLPQFLRCSPHPSRAPGA